MRLALVPCLLLGVRATFFGHTTCFRRLSTSVVVRHSIPEERSEYCPQDMAMTTARLYSIDVFVVVSMASLILRLLEGN